MQFLFNEWVKEGVDYYSTSLTHKWVKCSSAIVRLIISVYTTDSKIMPSACVCVKYSVYLILQIDKSLRQIFNFPQGFMVLFPFLWLDVKLFSSFQIYFGSFCALSDFFKFLKCPSRYYLLARWAKNHAKWLLFSVRHILCYAHLCFTLQREHLHSLYPA